MTPNRPDTSASTTPADVLGGSPSGGAGGSLPTWKPVATITTAEPFNRLFGITNTVLTSVLADMRRRGFDTAHPIIVWRGRNILIDGHTRMEAAKLANVKDVLVVERDFSDDDEAVRYAIQCQRARRNLTDAEIQKCVEELDKRKAKGARTDLASSEAKSVGKSADATAKLIGTSRAKVEKARTVEAQAAPEVKAAAKAGKLSINRAYNTTRKPRPAKSTPPLSEAERAKLAECERRIETGLATIAAMPDGEGLYPSAKSRIDFIAMLHGMMQALPSDHAEMLVWLKCITRWCSALASADNERLRRMVLDAGRATP